MAEFQTYIDNKPLLEAIKKLKIKFPVAEIVRMTQYSKSVVSTYLKPNARPSSEFLKKFEESFNVRLSDYISVSTNPDDVDVNSPFEQYAVTSKNGHETFNMPDGSYMMKVPMIPIKAHARYISEGDSAEFVEGQEYAYFMVDRVGKGRYRAFQIKGDSFWNEGGYDTPDKALVLGRELDRSQWKDGFRDSLYGWVIVTNENIVLKDIVSEDLERGEIVCHSRNTSKEYSDFPLSLDHEVKSIWKVIKRQF